MVGVSNIVPWRATPARRTPSTPAVTRPGRLAQRHPTSALRTATPPANTPALARGPIGFVMAFVEMQQQISRRKRAEKAELIARLEAEYQRRQRLQLAPPAPRALNR